MEGKHQGMGMPVIVVVAAHRRQHKSMDDHHSRDVRRSTVMTLGHQGGYSQLFSRLVFAAPRSSSFDSSICRRIWVGRTDGQTRGNAFRTS